MIVDVAGTEDEATLLETMNDETWLEDSVGITLDTDTEVLATKDDTDEATDETKLELLTNDEETVWLTRLLLTTVDVATDEDSRDEVETRADDKIEETSETVLLNARVDEANGADDESELDSITLELTMLLATIEDEIVAETDGEADTTDDEDMMLSVGDTLEAKDEDTAKEELSTTVDETAAEELSMVDETKELTCVLETMTDGIDDETETELETIVLETMADDDNTLVLSTVVDEIADEELGTIVDETTDEDSKVWDTETETNDDDGRTEANEDES